MLTTKAIPAVGDPARPGTVPIGDNARVALGLLPQACACAADAGTDLWDFSLEIGTLFDGGLTISDLRWLVAKRFAEHGQESSVSGGPQHIDDPLPVRGDINPPTRLHDAINRLNGCWIHPLLHFCGNGTGTGVCFFPCGAGVQVRRLYSSRG